MKLVFRSDSIFITDLNARRDFTCMEKQVTELSHAYSSRTTGRTKETTAKLKELYIQGRELFDSIREDYSEWNLKVRSLMEDPSINSNLDRTLDRKLKQIGLELSEEEYDEILALKNRVTDAGSKIEEVYMEALDIVQIERRDPKNG